MKISIIIVQYHVKKRLFECLQSIFDAKIDLDYEVIVVDNDEEKIIEKELDRKFPTVRYVASEQNVGFGAGNNIGAKHAKGEYLFFLNPDTIVINDCIDKLYLFLESNKNAAIVAPLLFTPPGGEPYPLQGAQELTPLRATVVLSFLNTFFPNNSISWKYWLLDWKKDTIKNVAVAPGTAFLIRKEIFRKVKGFDEQFFLYFEENDICKRVKMLGYNIFMSPEAKVIHFLGESTKTRKDRDKIFVRSRFLYFTKHYGVLSAILVTVFLHLKKRHVLLLGIFSLGAFLRFFRIEETFIFSGEVGHNVLAIKNAYMSKQIPFLGPPTSHPWLSFGPLFYWIYGPVLYFSGFNPLSHAYFGASVSLFIVLANYVVIKSILDTRVAMISSFLIAISPLFLEFSRGGRFFSIVTLLVYPFLFFLYKIAQKQKKYLFLLGFIFGCMFSFHFTPLMLIPFMVSVLLLSRMRGRTPLTLPSPLGRGFNLMSPLLRERIKVRGAVSRFLLGFFVPMLPFFVYDVMHGLAMTRNVALWIPYRVAGFLGLYHKNTVSQKVLQENVSSLFDFITKSFVPSESSNIGLAIFIILIIYIIWIILPLQFKKPHPTPLLLGEGKSKLFILLWFLWGYGAVFVHGSPPIHYFVPFLPAAIILFSIALDFLWQKRGMKYIVLGVFVLLVFMDFRHYFSNSWFFLQNKKVMQNPYYVPYQLQQLIAKTIVSDANGEGFILKRVGRDDQFEGDYAQNYQYLLWWYGNEPVKKAKLVYTIYEDDKRYKPKAKVKTEKIQISNITIIKSRL